MQSFVLILFVILNGRQLSFGVMFASNGASVFLDELLQPEDILTPIFKVHG